MKLKSHEEGDPFKIIEIKAYLINVVLSRGIVQNKLPRLAPRPKTPLNKWLEIELPIHIFRLRLSSPIETEEGRVVNSKSEMYMRNKRQT